MAKSRKQTKYVSGFYQVCRLARQGKENELRELPRHLITVAPVVNDKTPVMLLAEEGNDEAVELLIRKLYASLNDAVEGYARKENVAKVNELLARGASKNRAIYGYASAGFTELTYSLLGKNDKNDETYHHAIWGFAYAGLKQEAANLLEARDDEVMLKYLVRGLAAVGKDQDVAIWRDTGVDMAHAIFEYAKRGRVDKINELLLHDGRLNQAMEAYAFAGNVAAVKDLQGRGADIGVALMGYARAGRIDNVIDLLKQGVDRKWAIQGFARAGLIDCVNAMISDSDEAARAGAGYLDDDQFDTPQSFLRTLALTSNEDLYSHIVAGLQTVDRNIPDKKNLLKQAARLARIMKEYHLDYEQALALQTKGMRVWLQQGRHSNPPLPQDVVNLIAAKTAGLSTEDMKVIEKAVTLNTNHGAREIIKEKYRPGFFNRWFGWGEPPKVLHKKERKALAALQKRYQSDEKRIGIKA
ncbi:MAG TPA: hypothetical protein VL360_04905 [Gammaproteobacteria bacterium]|nr:hypothetical protein [Gammaproteobacteria bacterium]